MAKITASPAPVPLDDQLCYAIYSTGIAIQRAYKPVLDRLGLTYLQYLVLNVLWRADGQSVGAIAEELVLESSTLTPVLKRLEAAGLVKRARNPNNERQVVVSLSADGRAMRERATCINDTLLEVSGQRPKELAALNSEVRQLRDAIYGNIGKGEAG